MAANPQSRKSSAGKMSAASRRVVSRGRTSRQEFLALPPRDVRDTGARTLSLQASQQIGRPGYGNFRRATDNTKLSVRRLIQRNPADAMSLPVADKWTNTRIDLGGPAIRVMNQPHVAAANAQQRVVRPQRASAPVAFGPSGRARVVRPNNGLVKAGRLAR